MSTSSDPLSEWECPYILTTTAGIPEEQSLRHIIRTRFPNGMPEDFIAIIMGDILTGLAYLHVSLSIGHNDVNSSNICVDSEQVLTTIKLAVDPGKHFVDPGPAWREGITPNDGIRGLGITALEMGFGSLPRNCTGNADLVSLANNMIRILKLKLGYPDEKGEEEAENKGKEKLEIDDDQEMKEKAMQKGKKKLVIPDDQEMKENAMQKEKEKLELADDQEMKEKAMQKGKEKVELADDPKGKEMAKQKGKEKLEATDNQELKEKAKQKGKEKLEIADEELKNSTIKLPVLEKLLNISSVESPEKKLIKQQEGQQQKKKPMVAQAQKFKKAMKFFRNNKNDNADERKFSRDFLEVVLICLEEQKLTTAKQILEHPYFQKNVNLQKFEHSMRSHNFH